MPLVITGSGVLRGLKVVLAAAGIAALVSVLVMVSTPGDPFGGMVDDSRIQAVILSNDSVYFGRLGVASDEFFELRDVYFLQGSVEDEGAIGQQAISVSEQIHGPENRMLIRRSDVLAIQNLAEDSDLLEQIRQHQRGS